MINRIQNRTKAYQRPPFPPLGNGCACADSRRTAAALADGTAWTYGYDGKGQLLTAGRESVNETSLNAMTYSYDEIGNRLTASEDSTSKAYTANDLNQYTAIGSEVPTYDADGNMLTNDGWLYTWNSENRLIAAAKGTDRLEFGYDYMGRRMFKKVYNATRMTKHENYVYDGFKLVTTYTNGIAGGTLPYLSLTNSSLTGAAGTRMRHFLLFDRALKLEEIKLLEVAPFFARA